MKNILDVVIADDNAASSAVGKAEEESGVKRELLDCGHYMPEVHQTTVQPVMMSPKVPLAVYKRVTAAITLRWLGSLLFVVCLVFSLSGLCYAQNKVMGEVDFIGATQVEKNAGVWIDGQYVGYVNELKGNRKVLLLPGNHKISVRRSGYDDFTQEITVEPGQTQTINVTLQKNPRYQLPAVTAEIKFKITPDRAAVFVDDAFIGPARNFSRGVLVTPGKHSIKIDMPGYRSFTTEVTLLPNQKFTLKTQLLPGSINQASPLIKKQ